MLVVGLIFAVVWAGFWLYWLIAAFSMKTGRAPWSRELGIRVVAAATVLVLYKVGAFRHAGPKPGPVSVASGMVLLILGLGLAVWARRHLGRNWGTPMTQKEDPELVTSGPYRLVRHPIYSGLLLAALGTSIAFDLLWLIGVLIAALYFVYSAVVEEQHMDRRFPDVYPAYKRSTKMLIPHLL